MNLSAEIGKLRLKNPVMTASGTFGYGEEYSEFFDLERLGAVILKGISLEPRPGNPPPRICETPCGMLNAIGLQNVGLKAFLKEKLPFLRKFKTPVIANILGTSIGEYARLAKALADAGVEAVELNVSCPNVKAGGIEFGLDKRALGRLIRKVRQSTDATVIVKLSPMVTDIREFARVAEAEGADAVSLINTIPAMAIDARSRRPLLSNITGGLSGPAIKPIALRLVWLASGAVKIPVIGIGGIMNADDAVEFMLAGATAVAVGTANFINPSAPVDIIEGLEAYMKESGIGDIREIIRGLKC